MPIRFLPNDPATGIPARVVDKRAARSGGAIGFTLPAAPEEKVYAETDAGFTYWQAREAALRALEVWDEIGMPIGRWQDGSRRLALHPVHGVGLQGLYDRASLTFTRWDGEVPFFVAASADAVTHEVGHALLDALRPDLWDSLYPEITAFHEAFADCLCLFSCLLDGEQRAHLLASVQDPATALDQSNAASRIAESIAAAYGTSFSPDDPSATARDARNTLQWDFPHRLPSLVANGDLSGEAHSFSRVFTGSIYDCIRKLYGAGPPTSEGLREATRLTAELLIDATGNAPEGVDFFRRVGQAMVLADRSRYGGAHQHAIGMAFSAHGITLGSSSLVTPAMPLAGSARPGGGAVGLTATARRDLARRLNIGEHLRVNYRPVHLGGKPMVEAKCHRTLDLGRFNRDFRNVAVRIADSVLLDVDNDGSTPRVMDVLPRQSLCEEHVAAFASTVRNNGLLMADHELLSADHALKAHAMPAWSIRRQRGTPYLKRVRFSCHSRPGH